MKTYLSYGGGVNSTAMLLMLHKEGWEFESIYVDHGCDITEGELKAVRAIVKTYEVWFEEVGLNEINKRLDLIYGFLIGADG